MGKPTFEAGFRDQETGIKSWFLMPDAWFLIPASTRYEISESIGGFKQTRGTETSQYPEERTSTETPLVVASERGPGQWRTQDNRNPSGKRNLRG
jgi:hypothetical protein